MNQSNGDTAPPSLLVSTYKLFINTPFTVTVSMGTKWREMNNLSPEDVWSAGLHATSHLEGVPSQAVGPCRKCTKNKAVIELAISQGAEFVSTVGCTDRFVFNSCRTHCSSSRLHLGARVILSLSLPAVGISINSDPLELCSKVPKRRREQLIEQQQQQQQQQQGCGLASPTSSNALPPRGVPSFQARAILSPRIAPTVAPSPVVAPQRAAPTAFPTPVYGNSPVLGPQPQMQLPQSQAMQQQPQQQQQQQLQQPQPQFQPQQQQQMQLPSQQQLMTPDNSPTSSAKILSPPFSLLGTPAVGQLSGMQLPSLQSLVMPGWQREMDQSALSGFAPLFPSAAQMSQLCALDRPSPAQFPAQMAPGFQFTGFGNLLH